MDALPDPTPPQKKQNPKSNFNKKKYIIKIPIDFGTDYFALSGGHFLHLAMNGPVMRLRMSDAAESKE